MHICNLKNRAEYRTNKHVIEASKVLFNFNIFSQKGFTYDGAGPDAFFWVGESGAPGRGADTHVLAYPFTGKHFEYEDAETPKLEPGTSYDGSKVGRNKDSLF